MCQQSQHKRTEQHRDPEKEKVCEAETERYEKDNEVNAEAAGKILKKESEVELQSSESRATANAYQYPIKSKGVSGVGVGGAEAERSEVKL